MQALIVRAQSPLFEKAARGMMHIVDTRDDPGADNALETMEVVKVLVYELVAVAVAVGVAELSTELDKKPNILPAYALSVTRRKRWPSVRVYTTSFSVVRPAVKFVLRDDIMTCFRSENTDRCC